MSLIHIPPQETKRWTGIYPGAFLGILWKTFNVDLDQIEGKITLSSRLANVADTTVANDSALLNVTTFLRTNADNTDRWWGLSSAGRVFKTSTTTPGIGWVQDSLDSSPIDAVDMAIHENDSDSSSGENQLFVTRDTDIAVLNDIATNVWNKNWWVTTKAQTGLKVGAPHPIDVWNRLAMIGDGNLVHTIDKNEIVTYGRLALPLHLQIDHIFHTRDRAWILCSHKFGGNGAIVEWDGISQLYNNEHNGYSPRIMSGVNYREIPIVVNSKGQILEWNGNGFVQMERNGQKVQFPIAAEAGNSFSIATPFAIVPRGMTVSEDGLIYINVNIPVNFSSYRHSAGIWCLNPLTGRFYNKHSLGQWGASLDFGQQNVERVGAIYSLPASVSTVGFLTSGRIYDVYTGTPKSIIWTLGASTTATKGYFITQFIPSSQVRNFWDTIWIKNKPFITSSDRIVVKAKGTRSLQGGGGGTVIAGDPLEATITWTGASTFTLTLDASDDALAVGDEVEVLAGDNAGTLAHITVISGAHAALQTITIDEVTTVSATAAFARFDRWKKLGVISSTTNYENVLNVGIQSSFIQFKVEMRGPWKELEIEELIATFNTNIVAE